ncbi:carboxymuconolactone decarboxylase family protein [Actinomadura harenae]|uniref:Carboxymuconolactone decarboxylase family protein n=1 Tax=Actinomadura harenae TaxID=2483351 RepID=A0A3M2LJN2_9ACTN|nr:carboxymuconolactone decarboxylase family protein [Actinomadura harenae]RMI37651.1 carboxymuconolactone decarboxylase family protein [Actinomadura harenae]
MPHIHLDNDLPGIVGLFLYRPETARPMSELAEVLLRGPGTLERGERELIAAYVSGLNECAFCAGSHSAFAAAQLDGGADLVDRTRRDPATAPVSDKLKTLLAIAGSVWEGGRHVRPEQIDAARDHGATDLEIHDTVLIAAAFCMFNRYVDGLAALTPTDPAAYTAMADAIVNLGYMHIFPEPDLQS